MTDPLVDRLATSLLRVLGKLKEDPPRLPSNGKLDYRTTKVIEEAEGLLNEYDALKEKTQ